MTDQKYLIQVPDSEYYRQMVKCQAACPVLTDARGYVTALARGDLELGHRIARGPNPLATICGRICGAPCEVACRRGDVGLDYEPVAIRPLKRVLTECYGPESSRRLPGAAAPQAPKFSDHLIFGVASGNPEKEFSTARWSRENLQALANKPGRHTGKVAIVGAGPSGLSAAHDLALLGHKVTIFEGGPKSGGMMRLGVPIYRMDWEAMDMEVETILGLGVDMHYNTRVGEDVTLTELRRDFDAVYLGIGLMQGKRLRIEGMDMTASSPPSTCC